MEKETIKTIVYENIGLASMAWSETPKGVFDSELASKCGENIMNAFTTLTAENERLREALDGMIHHKCRYCNGDGYTAEHANHGHIDGDCDGQCPIQVECEDCHGEGYYVTLDTLRQALAPERKEVEAIEWLEKYSVNKRISQNREFINILTHYKLDKEK